MKPIKKWISPMTHRILLTKKKVFSIFKKKNEDVDTIIFNENDNVVPKSLVEIDSIYNQTNTFSKSVRENNSLDSTYNSHHSCDCICLFIMLVFYYLSIIVSKIKYSFTEQKKL